MSSLITAIRGKTENPSVLIPNQASTAHLAQAIDVYAEPLVRPQVAGISAWDPIFLGLDEYGHTLAKCLVNRGLLVGGLMGTGKSGLLGNVIGHISQTTDARLIGFDGKLVELSMWEKIFDYFVGQDIDQALHVLDQLTLEMQRRYEMLSRARRRAIRQGDGLDLVYLIIDELFMFTHVLGEKEAQEEFITKLMALVALGRAAGIIVVAATQRPTAAVVPTKLRELFGYRIAFRCATGSSGDVILGDEWSDLGFDVSKLDMETPGVGYIVAEEGTPFLFRSSYLDDNEIDILLARSLNLKGITS